MLQQFWALLACLPPTSHVMASRPPCCAWARPLQLGGMLSLRAAASSIPPVCPPAVDDKQATMQQLGGTWRLTYSSGFSSGGIGGKQPGLPAGEQCSEPFGSFKVAMSLA